MNLSQSVSRVLGGRRNVINQARWAIACSRLGLECPRAVDFVAFSERRYALQNSAKNLFIPKRIGSYYRKYYYSLGRERNIFQSSWCQPSASLKLFDRSLSYKCYPLDLCVISRQRIFALNRQLICLKCKTSLKVFLNVIVVRTSKRFL